MATDRHQKGVDKLKQLTIPCVGFPRALNALTFAREVFAEQG